MSTPAARRHPHVVHPDELEPIVREAGTRFGGSVHVLGRAAGASRLGCSRYEVPPGRSAMPTHFHCGVEEALYILSGTGTLRLGEEQVELRPGDWVTLPVGPAWPHRLDNTGTEPLCYLCLSSKATADVVGYPDSDKVAALAGVGGPGDPPWVSKWFRNGSAVAYFDGEDVG